MLLKTQLITLMVVVKEKQLVVDIQFHLQDNLLKALKQDIIINNTKKKKKSIRCFRFEIYNYMSLFL